MPRLFSCIEPLDIYNYSEGEQGDLLYTIPVGSLWYEDTTEYKEGYTHLRRGDEDYVFISFSQLTNHFVLG